VGAPTHAPVDLRRAYLVLAAVGFAGFQTAMALSIVFVVYPDLRVAFPDASPTTLSWVLNVFSIVGAATNVLGGAFGERVGRKRSLLIGVAGFTVASVVAATAAGPPVLIAARAVMAVCSSLILPVSAALILREFPDTHRGVAMGFWSMSGATAAALGPSLGGWLVDVGGWQWAFWVNVPLGVLALVAAALVLEESRDDDRRPWPDGVGSTLLMLGVGALVLALVETREWGWFDLRVLGLLLLGLGLLGLLVPRSRTHPRPIVQPALFRIAPYRTGNLVMLLFSVSFFGFQFVGVQFLTGVWGYDITTAGLLATPVFVGNAVMAPIAGRYVDRAGSRLIAPALLAWSVAIGSLALVLGSEPTPARWLLVVVLGGIASGFVWGSMFAVVMRALPPADFAVGASVTQTLQRVGNAFGVAIMVTVLASTVAPGDTDTFPEGFLVVAVVGAIAAALAARTVRPWQGA